MADQPLVGILMGSQSDAEVMDEAVKELEARGISHEVNVLSAHRDPEAVREYALSAEARGLKVIIAGAGKAAALPGVVAAMTDLPGDRRAHPHLRPGRARFAPLHGADAARRAGGHRGHQRGAQRGHPGGEDPAGGRAGGAQARGARAARTRREAPDDRALLHARDGGHLDRRGPHGGVAPGGAGRVRGLGPHRARSPRTPWPRSRPRPPSTSTGSARSSRPPSTT